MEKNKMIVTTAKDPQWVNAEQTLIHLYVKFEEFPDYLDFVASPTDCEEHGRTLFAEAVKGTYGVIAAMAAPIPPQPNPYASLVNGAWVTDIEVMRTGQEAALVKAEQNAILKYFPDTTKCQAVRDAAANDLLNLQTASTEADLMLPFTVLAV